MTSNAILGRHIESFFREYLTLQRNVSSHTQLSYRDTLKLFLKFAARRLPKAVVDLEVGDFKVDLVLGFLDHLETERKNSIATRNVRLAALHAFFRHVASRDPESFALCHRIAAIPLKRGTTAAVTYLEPEELDAILGGIDRKTREGRRDYALLCFSYQTGARVQEVLGVRACDLRLEAPAHVRLWGKGRKERIIPLWTQTSALLRTLLDERNIDARSTSLVFANMKGGTLTRWGVRHVLAKYVRIASEQGTRLAPKRIHPHTLRHTAAVHMLQAGVDPNSIRDILGHASSETTWRYARITLETKRKAIGAFRPNPKDHPHQLGVPRWRHDEDLLAQLEALGRQSDYVAPDARDVRPDAPADSSMPHNT